MARARGASPHRPDCDFRWFARGPEVTAGLKAAGPGSGCLEVIGAGLARGHGRWAVALRQLWMVPTGARLPAINATGAANRPRDIVVRSPSREAVMRAVAKTCRYPRVLLSPALDGEYPLRLLDARRGIQLSAMYGSFRSKGGSGKPTAG